MKTGFIITIIIVTLLIAYSIRRGYKKIEEIFVEEDQITSDDNLDKILKSTKEDSIIEETEVVEDNSIRELTPHIESKVINLHPDSKKNLNKKPKEKRSKK